MLNETRAKNGICANEKKKYHGRKMNGNAMCWEVDKFLKLSQLLLHSEKLLMEFFSISLTTF